MLAAGTAAQAAYAAALVGIAAIAPQLRAEYGLTLAQVGLVLTASSLGMVGSLLLWGYAADRIGERGALAGGLGASGTAIALAAAVDSFGPLVVLLVLAGTFGAGVNTASGRAVMGWFPPGQRGLALGIRQSAMPAGAAVAALTLPHLGARQALVALGAACVAAAAGGAAVVRDAPAVHEPPPDVPWTLRDGRLWTLGISSGLLMMTQVTLLSFAVLFLHDARGVSAAVAAVVLAAVQAVGFVLRIATGVWSDRAGSRVGPFRVVTLAATATLAAAAALADAPLWLLVPALILAGGTSMGWNTLSFTAAAELGGRARAGTAIGFQQTALSVAAAVAGPLFALAVDATSWQAAYAFAALLPLLAFGLLRRLPG